MKDEAALAPMNMEQPAAHYQHVELPSKAFSTQEGYKNYIHIHILPRWVTSISNPARDVTRSIWRNVEGDTKTEASRKPVLRPPVVIEELKEWRRKSLYLFVCHGFCLPVRRGAKSVRL